MKAPDMAGAITLTDWASAPGKETALRRNRFSPGAGAGAGPAGSNGVLTSSAVSFMVPPSRARRRRRAQPECPPWGLSGRSLAGHWSLTDPETGRWAGEEAGAGREARPRFAGAGP